MEKEKRIVLSMDEIVIFPKNEVRMEIENTLYKEVLTKIDSSKDKLMIIVNPIDNNDKTDFNDITRLPNIGVLAYLKLKIEVPNGKTKIIVEGLKRVKINKYFKEDNFYTATHSDIEQFDSDINYENILIKALEKYINKVPYMSNAVISQLDNASNLDELCDIIASFLPVNYNKKKEYIQMINPIDRTKLLIEDMNTDLKYVELERKIEQDVEKELSETQKEYFLREKIKAIQKELGEVNSKTDEIVKLKQKCNNLKCNSKIKSRIKSEISRYELINSNSPELGMIRDYIDWLLNLPWNHYTKDISDLEKVKETLDKSHFGLEDVKSRIIEYLAVKKNTGSIKSPILCLVGPPGVGKTSLALSIAKSLGRNVTKISVGGINDEAEIVGHRRTYIGANPGRIIQGIRKAKSANPVFIIDEIDKMTKDIKGDPASSLLEVLDPEQNCKFSDHYIEEDFDLSQVFFIATANYIEQIPYELRDRLEIINLSSYTEYEKLDIAKNYLIPKKLEEHGLTPLQVEIKDDALLILIRNYTKESGVRELERVISSLLRKIVKKMLMEKKEAFYSIDEKLLEELLGKKKYHYMTSIKNKLPGIVNGMAYTVFGGDILPIEATLFKGNGNLILTGSLGEVMQESCKIALDYIKSNSKRFGIDNNIFKDNDIHIHVPEGAVNKDGPSAGITICTTLISLFTNIPIDNKISMTGEITLRGQILGIGGLKEKVIGASRAGIKKIYIPKANEVDLEEIPNEIRKNIKFKLIDNYIEVYEQLFERRKVCE